MSFLIEKWQNDDQPLTDDKKLLMVIVMILIIPCSICYKQVRSGYDSIYYFTRSEKNH